jgi:hypothetical protein
MSAQLLFCTSRNGSRQNVGVLRTEVVLTPQSNSETVEDAAGVSMNSKVSSEVLPLILRNSSEFCRKERRRGVFRGQLHTPRMDGVAH